MSSTDPSNRGSWLVGILLLALGCLSLAGGAAAAAAQVPANGRAWELVSPADPNGAVIYLPVGITADGDRIAYESFGSIPGSAGGELLSVNLSVRNAGGWESHSLSVPFEAPDSEFEFLLSPLVVAFDSRLAEDLRTSRISLVPGGPEAPMTGIYRIGSGGTTLLASVMGTTADSTVRGASDDLSHVVFQAEDHLVPSDAGRTSGKSIYEWTAAGLRQVDIDTSGTLLSECGSSVAAVDGVSDSGERVYFTNPSSGCELPKRLYLREANSATVEVSASHCTRPDCNAPADAEFLAATPDGSVVLFATTQQLVNADEDEFRDLYRYDVEGGSLELVSVRSPGETGAVAGEAYAAANGSRVYFFAEGRLLSGLGSEAGRNLYMADGSGVHFVAVVEDAKPQMGISHDGGVALFRTSASLESADTDDQADAYLYEAGTGRLTRVSAGSGGNGPFEVTLRDAVPRGGGLFEIPIRAPFGGSLSENGARAFFTTKEPLLPEDRNEVADVYEWTGGALGLLSSGEGNDDAEFVGATPDGRTALFRTSASLLPEDQDGGDHDLYAARIGGGFPTPTGGTSCVACSTPAGSVSRPKVATSTPPVRARGHIRVGRLGGKAGVRALVDGFLRLPLYVPAPGKVVASGRVRLGRRYRTAARGVAGAVRPGRLELSLVLSPRTRRLLRSRGAVALRLTVRQGDLQLEHSLMLRAGGRR